MSKSALEAIAIKYLQDEAFRTAFAKDPHAAIAGFDLTPEEARAVAGRDQRQLVELGVDERLVKGSLN